MRSVTIHEAKTHLSRLLAAVERGEEVIVARASRPIARIVRFDEGIDSHAPTRRQCFGVDASGWRVPDDFDAPLDDHILELFE